jgi:hypothetical protein
LDDLYEAVLLGSIPVLEESSPALATYGKHTSVFVMPAKSTQLTRDKFLETFHAQKTGSVDKGRCVALAPFWFDIIDEARKLKRASD